MKSPFVVKRPYSFTRKLVEYLKPCAGNEMWEISANHILSKDCIREQLDLLTILIETSHLLIFQRQEYYALLPLAHRDPLHITNSLGLSRLIKRKDVRNVTMHQLRYVNDSLLLKDINHEDVWSDSLLVFLFKHRLNAHQWYKILRTSVDSNLHYVCQRSFLFDSLCYSHTFSFATEIDLKNGTFFLDDQGHLRDDLFLILKLKYEAAIREFSCLRFTIDFF